MNTREITNMVRAASVLVHTAHAKAAEYLLDRLAEDLEKDLAKDLEWDLKEAPEDLDKMAFYLGRPTEDFFSPDLGVINERCPVAYQTILGWMAVAYSTELRRWLDEGRVLREIRRLRILLSEEEGDLHPDDAGPFLVRADPYLKECCGVDYVTAYPMTMLVAVLYREYGK